MRIAMGDPRLDELIVVCPGETAFPLDEKIHVKGLAPWANPPRPS